MLILLWIVFGLAMVVSCLAGQIVMRVGLGLLPRRVGIYLGHVGGGVLLATGFPAAHLRPEAACCLLAGVGLLLATREAAQDTSSLLRPIRARHDLAGLIGVVIDGHGEILSAGRDGVRMRGCPAPLEADDPFHLGSCTKAMTATMIASLVEDGTLAWETTLAEVFTDVPMHPDWEDVTLDLLLECRAGAPAEIPPELWKKLWELVDAPPVEQRRALVAGILASPPGPRGQFVYSNAGYSIAGALAETVTAVPFEALMESRLFAPLGMESPRFGPPDVPWGHLPDGSPVEPGKFADNPACLTPAGRVSCTLADWARFLALHVRFHADGSQEDPPDWISPATVAALHVPPAGSDYARGWLTCTRPWAGGPALTHAGSNGLWFVVTWLAPKRDFAVLVACNQGGDEAAAGVDEAAWALIQHHLNG